MRMFTKGGRAAGARDEGSTLIVAMMVMMLAATLGAVVVKSAINTNAESGVDRQRTVSINAAEAGVDATFATMEGSGTSLPCQWPASGNYDVNAEPDPTHVTVAITYYDSAGTQLACSGGTLPSSVTPASAVIDSTAQLPRLLNAPRSATRHMQAAINLTPVRGQGLTQAVFGNSTIVASQHATVNAGANGDGNLYTNGDFVCANHQTYQGSVYAPTGSITLQNSCTVQGDVWAAASVQAPTGYNGTIGGRVIAGTGSIALNGGSVGGTLQAAGTISYSGCTPNKCFANEASAAPTAPSQPFPHIYGDATTLNSVWGGAGWTIVQDNNCGSIVTDIKNTYANNTSPTLVTTTCSVAFSSVGVTFKGNFALFASGGISTQNNVSFYAPGSVDVYMIVPWDNYDGSLHSCPQGDIAFNQHFSTDPSGTVNLLAYTPCDLSYSNNNTSGNFGQIYAGGTVTIANNYEMTYTPIPVPSGAIDPATLPTLSYTVAILHKEETLS